MLNDPARLNATYEWAYLLETRAEGVGGRCAAYASVACMRTPTFNSRFFSNRSSFRMSAAVDRDMRLAGADLLFGFISQHYDRGGPRRHHQSARRNRNATALLRP